MVELAYASYALHSDFSTCVIGGGSLKREKAQRWWGWKDGGGFAFNHIF